MLRGYVKLILFEVILFWGMADCSGWDDGEDWVAGEEKWIDL
jgi:hypothetical protein